MEQIENALYLVATPIGNLADLSYRAVHILQNVDTIAAEDTRTTSVLLKHFNISNNLTSYYSQNINFKTGKLIELLKSGQSLALVSDAGTPGISDPGYHLVQECIRNNIRVIPIPGASAFLSALVGSGLPNNKFCYEGFLPQKKGRQTRIKELKTEKRTIIFYESPHRIHKTISQLYESWGERNCTIARELTKKFEEFIYSSLKQLSENPPKLKGEIVLIIEGAS